MHALRPARLLHHLYTFTPPALAGLVMLLLAGSAAPPALLSARIDRILERSDTESAFWGIYAEDLTTGAVLYRHNATHTFMPASNMKLYTSATALDVLGGDHRYQTKLLFDGRVRGSVLSGDLILHGSGDPTFGSTQVAGPDPLAHWAERLASMGVTSIEGRLIGDDDAFGERPYGEGWPIDYVTTQASRLMGVSAGGIAYHDNFIAVEVRSGAPGRPPRFTTRPPGYLTVRNNAATTARSRGSALKTDRAVSREVVTVTGSVPRSYKATVFLPVANPTRFALYCFRHELEQAGINVEALKIVDIDAMDDAPDADDARLLFLHLSPTLADILPILNKESNNFYADQVFRSFGWGGTAEGAAHRVKAFLQHAGANTEVISIRDGSGLSRKDYVTPRVTVQLLTHMYAHPEHAAFLRSLPEGGEPKTTLRYRLRDVPVRAKTGSLEFARALSGYVTTANDHVVAFSIFANNYVAPPYRIIQTMDRITHAIAATRVG